MKGRGGEPELTHGVAQLAAAVVRGRTHKGDSCAVLRYYFKLQAVAVDKFELKIGIIQS